jgi:glycosyltransferase involved in cell wall biosynthesis
MITRFLARHRWEATIVKSKLMKELLRIQDAIIVPNGVDMERFKPLPSEEARKHVGYPLDKRLILFASDPGRKEKNPGLAERAVRKMDEPDIELRFLCNVPNADIPYYLNAADALLLTSKWEGSPNIIKEAMACNCPIVSTNVGDISWVTGDTAGCFLTSFDDDNIALNLRKTLAFGHKTKGRERIRDLGIDSKSVALTIRSIYEEIIARQ